MRKPRGKGYRMGTNLAIGVGVKLWCLVMMFYLSPSTTWDIYRTVLRKLSSRQKALKMTRLGYL